MFPGEAGLWFSNPPAHTKTIVIAESPLIALAYHQQNRAANVQYMATSSQALSPAQAQYLAAFAASRTHRGQGPEIVVATSRGGAGAEHARCVREALAGAAIRRAVRAHAPTVADDWLSSAARRERSLVRQLSRDNARFLGNGF
jgi:Toprim-like